MNEPQQKSFFYFLRESSAFFLIWLSLLLMYSIICAYTNQVGQDEFYRVIFFLQKPWVITLNGVALLMLLLHTAIWFTHLHSNYVAWSKTIFICGTWAAIFSPIMMIIIGYFVPFGDVTTRSLLLKMLGTESGKVVIFLMVILPIWYALPRILQTLHDFNIHPKREKLLVNGLALAWSAHTIYILCVR
ncbi:hypothetical protein PT273_00210 [Orbaceae bacterium ESL0727]|nr:hypothetical protein [Orbaceae bacterium ESL0727]